MIQALALDMRTIPNETSKEPSSATMQKFGFRSAQSFNWVHILLFVIWWIFGWVLGMCFSSHKSKGDFETLALCEILQEFSSRFKMVMHAWTPCKLYTFRLTNGEYGNS
ncbi:hypothetical protein Hdeb2414_s0070g00772441 [Helianthus debilis subsp. tardiflorus]